MKLWMACLLTMCAVGALWTRLEHRETTACQIEEHVKQLYNSGQKGLVLFKPGVGHQLVSAKALLTPAPQTQAVTYGFSGGRLGDNLLSYFHARWVAYRHHVPLVFKPFPGAEEFALGHEPRAAVENAVEVPYFPEPSMKNWQRPFDVDWDDPEFREEIERCLTPIRAHNLLELPADRISVCVHVRRGSGLDTGVKEHLMQPLKFPPDSYYIDQIRRVARIFEDKPLYLFVMTDDRDPTALVARYQKAIRSPNIQWACRTSPPADPLDDFFSIPKFDCLILCDSNFSIVASKLTEYALRIAPTHYAKKKHRVRVTGLEIAFNPAYKKTSVAREKVLIGGVGRNIARAIPHLVQNAEALGSRFQDYAVLLYENDSTDATPQQLKAWAARNPHVVVVSEILSTAAPSRTERIADARNAVLAMARRPEYAEFKYFVVVDLDFTTAWPIEQIVRNVERGGDWDMLAANGVYPNGDYYDRYALRSAELPLGPEMLGSWWRMQLERAPLQLKGTERVPVFSAFGGLALYKTSSLLSGAYSGTVTSALRERCKQILLTHHGRKPTGQIREYVRQLGLPRTSNLKPVPVVFVENTYEEHADNVRRITCCEHVPLHAMMALQGHGKLFIDPEMRLVNAPPP